MSWCEVMTRYDTRDIVWHQDAIVGRQRGGGGSSQRSLDLRLWSLVCRVSLSLYCLSCVSLSL